jgi:hypothetical protein
MAVISPAAPAAASHTQLSRRPATTHGTGKRQKFPAFARNHGKITMILAVPGRHALPRLSTGVTITAVEERKALCISAVREPYLILYLPVTFRWKTGP